MLHIHFSDFLAFDVVGKSFYCTHFCIIEESHEHKEEQIATFPR